MDIKRFQLPSLTTYIQISYDINLQFLLFYTKFCLNYLIDIKLMFDQFFVNKHENSEFALIPKKTEEDHMKKFEFFGQN